MQPLATIAMCAALATSAAMPQQSSLSDNDVRLIATIDDATVWHNRYTTTADRDGDGSSDLHVYLWIMNGWLDQLSNPPSLIDNLFLRLLFIDQHHNEALLVTIQGMSTTDPAHTLVTTHQRSNNDGRWRAKPPAQTLLILASRYHRALGAYPEDTPDFSHGLSDLLRTLFPTPPRYERRIIVPLNATDQDQRFIVSVRSAEDPDPNTTEWGITISTLLPRNPDDSDRPFHRFRLTQDQWHVLTIDSETISTTGRRVAFKQPPHFFISNYGSSQTIGKFMNALPGPRLYDILRIPVETWTDRDALEQ